MVGYHGSQGCTGPIAGGLAHVPLRGGSVRLDKIAMKLIDQWTLLDLLAIPWDFICFLGVAAVCLFRRAQCGAQKQRHVTGDGSSLRWNRWLVDQRPQKQV